MGERFHATDFFLPLKTTECQRFCYVFRGYKKRPVAWNKLCNFAMSETMLQRHFNPLTTNGQII